MRVIPPLTITDALLTDTSVPEPDTGEVAWNAATSYTVGQTVYLASNHTRYENLIAGVNATSPHLDDGTRWLELGPTNRWAMFDLLRNTGTTDASPLVVEITPGRRVDSLAIVGAIADSVTVEMVNGVTTVYSRTENLSTRDTSSWYEYFFGSFGYRSAVALFDLPPYVAGVITVTFTRAAGDVTVGGLILGTSVYVGDTQFSAESDALNFSTVERDEFGNSLLVPRRTVPKTNQTLFCDKARVNRIIKVREDLNAVPALWSGLDDASDGYFEALLILGYYRRFTVSLDHPDVAVISLELEEV